MTSTGNPDVLSANVAGLPANVTDDTFLGDRLRILQPASGYRAGVDAVLLAASVAGTARDVSILDCGAGVGVVGLCVAARCPTARVTLVEREPDLVRLARENCRRNGLEARVSVYPGDVTAAAQSPLSPTPPPESFDVILANPPFHDDACGTHAPNPLKRASHAMAAGGLDAWLRFAARMCRPGGYATLIHKAEALPSVLTAFQHRFGGLSVIPLHPYADKSATRVLVTGIKGSRAPLKMRPAIVLHEQGGAFTPYVGRILRHGAPLTASEPKD